MDPAEYMNAPAMILAPHPLETVVSHTSYPPILTAAIDSAESYELLSPEKLQSLYTELHNLTKRFEDAKTRLDVQTKLCDAARNISKLNDDPGTKSSRRLSRLLGNDNKSEKRKSRALDEVAFSKEKIEEIKLSLHQLSEKKVKIESRIMEHHSGVMSRALRGCPLPVNGSEEVVSLNNNPQWIVPKLNISQGNIGVNRVNSMANSMANSSTKLRMLTSSETSDANELVQRIIEQVPELKDEYKGDNIAFFAGAFESLALELAMAQNESAALKDQLRDSEDRINFLSARSPNNVVQPAGLGAIPHEIVQLRNELGAEHAIVNNLQLRLKTQRNELQQTTKALEDVMALAVKYESERAYFEQLIQSNAEHVQRLEQENATLSQQKLSTAQNTGLLCQEFRQIIADLVQRHQQEMRSLQPRGRTPSFDSAVNAEDVIRRNPILKDLDLDETNAQSQPSDVTGNSFSMEQDSSIPDISFQEESNANHRKVHSVGSDFHAQQKYTHRRSSTIPDNRAETAPLSPRSPRRTNSIKSTHTYHTVNASRSLSPNHGMSPSMNSNMNSNMNSTHPINHSMSYSMMNTNTNNSVYQGLNRSNSVRSSATPLATPMATPMAASHLGSPNDSLTNSMNDSYNDNSIQGSIDLNPVSRHTPSLSRDLASHLRSDDASELPPPIQRPVYERRDSEESKESNSSSYYPDPSSANVSQLSLGNRQYESEASLSALNDDDGLL